MKTPLAHLLLLLVTLLCLSACAMTRAKSVTGSTFTSVSVGENADDKWFSYDPESGRIFGQTVKQNQVDGLKAVGGAINTGIGIDRAARIWDARIARDKAIETATIQAGSDLDLAREANRSAEALRALDIEAAEAAAAAGP